MRGFGVSAFSVCPPLTDKNNFPAAAATVRKPRSRVALLRAPDKPSLRRFEFALALPQTSFSGASFEDFTRPSAYIWAICASEYGPSSSPDSLSRYDRMTQGNIRRTSRPCSEPLRINCRHLISYHWQRRY